MNASERREGASRMKRSAVDQVRIPAHVAIIMDGNGRWARRRFLPRVEGHRNGAKTVRMVVEECRSLSIRYLTLFAFSTENWQRPAEEVSALMFLFRQYLESEVANLVKHNIRLRAAGDLSRLSPTLQEGLRKAEEATKHLDGMDLILAVSYGGREEILHSVREIAKQVQEGTLSPDDISHSHLRSHFYLPDVPDPDLLIRTSDENRISNFLLWQLAYSEIVVSPVLWPAFDRDEFHRCLREYTSRNRRFGLTAEQIEELPMTSAVG
jgi:undecaprenyl diphosphate synthase